LAVGRLGQDVTRPTKRKGEKNREEGGGKGGRQDKGGETNTMDYYASEKQKASA